MVTILSALIQVMEIRQCANLFSAAPFLRKSRAGSAHSHNQVRAQDLPKEKRQQAEQHFQLHKVIYSTKND